MIVLKATIYIKKIITKFKCWKCGINSGGGVDTSACGNKKV